jgi:hypothetical protein
MQQLHETVYAIADRADSEIVTVYNIAEHSEARLESESADLYKGFPISVDVIEPEKARVVESPFFRSPAAVLRQKLRATSLRPIIKAGIAAAAALLIGVGLLLNTPSAKAVTIEQIYKAIEKARNVYIASFVPDKNEPVQEKWVFKSLNIYMTKTGNELVLWDISNAVRKNKQLGVPATDTTSLSADSVAGIRVRISGSLGLMPFADISEIPAKAMWEKVSRSETTLILDDYEVHDLTWVEKDYGGPLVYRKWRVSVNLRTHLPYKAEIYRKSEADDQWILNSVLVVSYLSDNDLQTAIENFGF